MSPSSRQSRFLTPSESMSSRSAKVSSTPARSPTRAPIFFGLASTVGFSRIYVGAHYPGDVLSGAALGMIIAEAIRRPVRRIVR